MSDGRTGSGTPIEAAGAEPASGPDFHRLFRAMPAVCAVLAPDPPRFTIVAATDAYCRAAQTPCDRLAGRELFDAFPDAFPGTADPDVPASARPARRIEAALRESLMEVLRTRAAHRMTVQRYDMPDEHGSPRPRFWQPVNLPLIGPDGAVQYILHSVDDVTDQMGNAAFQREMTRHLASFNEQLSQNADEREGLLTQVRAEHERTSEVLESISDIFYAVDERFRFTYVNRRAAEVWRRTASDLIGRSLWDVFPSVVGTESYDRHLEVMALRQPVQYETVSTVLNRWIDVSIYPSAGGGLAVYFHDIEDRKRAEAERESARAEAESVRCALVEAQGALESRVKERTMELARANEALSAALAERERAERDRNELLRKLALAQEEERRRLSRDLHDEVGQHLTALGLGLRALCDVVPSGSEVDRRATQLHALATSLGQELHALAVRLRPRVLDDFGLEAALASYAHEWTTRHGVPVEVHAACGVERVPAAVESAVYRIAQEALTNVAKHSGATRASIVLERRDGHLHVIVEDDGRGFDAEAPIDSEPRQQGLGLLGIRERAAMLGGTVQVESAPDAGTTIFVRLPIETVDGDDRHLAGSDSGDA